MMPMIFAIEKDVPERVERGFAKQPFYLSEVLRETIAS
jgi:hypothetical protein